MNPLGQLSGRSGEQVTGVWVVHILGQLWGSWFSTGRGGAPQRGGVQKALLWSPRAEEQGGRHRK